MKEDKSCNYKRSISPLSPSPSPPASPNIGRAMLISSSSSSNSPFSPAPSPSPSPRSSPAPFLKGCSFPHCLVCTKGAPPTVLSSPTWSSIMRVVFYTLHCAHPEKEFFNLRSDLYLFIGNHWNQLCPSKDVNHNWKKQIQDMLSHSKNMFESGTGIYKQNGYWRLKWPQLDPWTVHKQTFHHRHTTKNINNSSNTNSNKKGLHHRDRQFTHHPPPAKKRRTSGGLAPLTEHTSLVSSFRSLQEEMTSMRKRMNSILATEIDTQQQHHLHHHNNHNHHDTQQHLDDARSRVYSNGQISHEFGSDFYLHGALGSYVLPALRNYGECINFCEYKNKSQPFSKSMLS